MLAAKKNGCSQGICTSLSTLNHKFLSTFTFVPKINDFLSKIPPISHTFHSVHSPFVQEGRGRGVEPPKFQKGGDLAGSHLLEGDCWEIGGNFFQAEVAIFTEKIKNLSAKIVFFSRN